MDTTGSKAERSIVESFFRNPENKKIIKENQEYSKKISDYVKQNVTTVNPETLKTPFGPVDGNGNWSHERR